ncbi:unnamed protein product [Orchesella dallaii]|uniref:Dynamin-type G domain-containing protein n=1 Tax=Orchesella dallaii TaxID=48710 RepID=A0ABP1R3I4_9HEXA
MIDFNSLVTYMCKVQRKFGSKIDLPRIVVIGAQSSGKSSVLDSLVGLSIFPRGTGTVTTCPTIVQLIQITDENEKEGVELEDLPYSGRMVNHDEIRTRIGELMMRNEGQLVETPIIVRVYSLTLLPFTVIDMPGITKIPGTAGLSEGQLKDLSRSYISEENSIIFAVSPANNDIQNSEAITLAKEVDPNGNRTLGVLTKIDIMEPGTDARKELTGKHPHVQLKLGMIGIMNRSQEDITRGLTVDQQLEREESFLEHQYPDLADKNGVPYLRKKLHELLVPHILKCLPGNLRQFEEELESCRKRLAGVPADKSRDEEFDSLFETIRRFESNMKTEIEGSTFRPESSYIYGGVIIKEIFQKRFPLGMESAEKTSQVSSSDADDFIITSFLNSGSYDSIGVFAEGVFRTLTANQIMTLVQPALECAKEVHTEVVKVADRNLTGKGNEHLKFFPALRTVMRDVATQILDANLKILKNHLTTYVQVQSHDIFSLDPSFLTKIADLKKDLEIRLNPGSAHTLSVDSSRSFLKESGITDVIKTMVKEYFFVVKSHIQGYVPKLIAAKLLQPFTEKKGSFGLKLLTAVRQRQKLGPLMELAPEVRRKRDKDIKLRKDLKEVIREGYEKLNIYTYEMDGDGAFQFRNKSNDEQPSTSRPTTDERDEDDPPSTSSPKDEWTEEGEYQVPPEE